MVPPGRSGGSAARSRARHAEKAVAIDEDYECQDTLGWILLHCKQFDLSEQHYQRVIELNPNSPAELTAMGAACSFLGRPDEGIRWFELARRIDPYFDAELVLEPAGRGLLQCAAL